MQDMPTTDTATGDTALGQFFEWVDGVRIADRARTVERGRLALQLNLYVLMPSVDALYARLAAAAEAYRDRFAPDLRMMQTAPDLEAQYRTVPFPEAATADLRAAVARTGGEIYFSSSLDEEVGGAYDFRTLVTAYANEALDGADHLALVQISMSPARLPDLGEPLRAMWRTYCELLQPLHGSGGLGLTVPADPAILHQSTANLGLYRRYVEAWPCVEANATEVAPHARATGPDSYRDWIRTTGWVTVLGDAMAARLDQDLLAEALADDQVLERQDYAGGMMLSAGGWPILGDAANGISPAYGTVARLTRHLRNPHSRPLMLDTMDHASYEAKDAAFAAWRDRFDAV